VLLSRTLAGEPEFTLPIPAYAASPIYHAEPPALYHSAPSIGPIAIKAAPILKAYEPAPILKTFEPAPILKSFEASPLLKTFAPAPIFKSYEPTILKSYEPAPLLKYAPAPVAIKTAVKAPVATSYATTTSVHVTHPVAKIAAPVVKYAAAPVVKYAAPALIHSEPIVKYAAPAISLKTAESPLLSFSHEAPSPLEYAPSFVHGLDSYEYH
jgi:hypothetical protein